MRLAFALWTIPLIAPPVVAQTQPLRFDGEIRLRGEWDHRTAGAGADAATLARVRLGVLVTAHPRIRAYVQLQDARAWGSESSTLTDATADQLDLHQAWVAFGSADDAVGARLGRQVLSLGDERLVGAVGWTNTGRAFDGAVLSYRHGTLDLRAFWMTVAERDALVATGLDPQNNQGVTDDGWLLGGFGTARVGEFTLEGTVLHDRNAATDASWTVSGRGFGSSAGFRIDATAAGQFGQARRAFLLSGYLGRAVGGGWLGAQVDYLSGDHTPGTGTRRAFHTLYATNHKFYGFMDYLLTPGQLGEAGLVDAMVRLAMPTAGWRWSLDGHLFATPQPLGGSRRLGTEVDVVSSRPLAERAVLSIGAAAFRASAGAVAALPAFAGGAAGDWAAWAYAQLTLRWQ